MESVQFPGWPLLPWRNSVTLAPTAARALSSTIVHLTSPPSPLDPSTGLFPQKHFDVPVDKRGPATRATPPAPGNDSAGIALRLVGIIHSLPPCKLTKWIIQFAPIAGFKGEKLHRNMFRPWEK